MKLNSKIKIILVLVGFVLFTGAMFWFGYDIIGARNHALADSIAKQRVELNLLQREQKSFEEGKKDLAELAKSAYPPEDLFSRDTKVVKEIQQLEAVAQKYDIDLTLTVSGTSQTAVKATGTSAELFAVPYKLILAGTFENTLKFMQVTQRLPFITHAKDISVVSTKDDQTRTQISSEFYIKK